MKRKQLTFTVLALLLTQLIWAQDKLSLDLKAAKEYALQYNKTLKNSGLSVDKAQEKLWETIAAGLPQVNASTDYTNSMGAKISIQFQDDVPATEIPIKPTSNFQVQVGQLIFNGGYLVGIQSMKLLKELSEKNFEKSEQEVISQVIDGYLLVLISKESLVILNNNLKNLQDIYDKTSPMVEVGMMEKVELDQLYVQLNTMQNAVRSAERQLEMTKNMLRLQLGVTAETPIQLTETLNDLMAIDAVNQTLAADFNLNSNIDFQIMDYQEKLTEKQLMLEKSNYLPTVTGFYQFTKKILKPAFDMSPPHVVGLQMNIPVFSSGEKKAKVNQARLELETIQNTRSLMEDQLSIQSKQLTYNLKNAVETYQTQKENIKISREVYKSLQDKYKQGIISGLELTTADNNYLKAESDHLKSIYDVLKANNELNKLLGRIQ